MSLFFTLGTSTTFALLGIVVSLIGGIFGTSKSILIYIAAAVSIAVGLKMLGIIKFNLPNIGTRILRKPGRQGIWAAFLMGLMIGLAGSQCGTPVLFAVLSLVMSKGKIVYGAVLLFLYGLGRGLPVIIAGTFTGFAKGLPYRNIFCLDSLIKGGKLMDERLFAMEAEFFKALAHPTRVRILKHLRASERCVCEFTEDLDVEQSNMSQHLAILRKQDIVSFRKEGLKVMYRVNYPQIFEILDLVEDIMVSQVNETLDLLNKRPKRKGGE